MTEPPLRVLHVTEGFDGGVITFLRHVLPAQRARGVKVSLMCSPRHEACYADLESLRRGGIDVQLLHMSRGLELRTDVTALMTLTRKLCSEPYDIVHTHCFKAGVLGRIAVRLAGRSTLVHTPHCWPFMRCRSRSAAWLCRAVDRALERWTDCLMLVSESQRQASQAVGIGNRAPCQVIPNGLPISVGGDGARLRRELGLDPAVRVVGTLCRLVPYKCVDHFVQAAARVHEHLDDVVFLIAGDGPERKRLSHLVQSLKLNNIVRMLGHRSDAEQIMSMLDVCVLCSQAEGMPYVILEAMRSGAAVVASKVPGNIDMIEDGRLGVLYEWGNIDRLTEGMLRCLTDASLRQTMTQHAREYVMRHHCINDRVDEMLSLYQQLASWALFSGSLQHRNVPASSTPPSGGS